MPYRDEEAMSQEIHDAKEKRSDQYSHDRFSFQQECLKREYDLNTEFHADLLRIEAEIREKHWIEETENDTTSA